MTDTGMMLAYSQVAAASLKEENDRLRSLLTEWATDTAITDYDSSVCWGCGELKTKPHFDGCLLGRTQKELNGPVRRREMNVSSLWVCLFAGLIVSAISSALLIQDHMKPYVCAHLAGTMLATRQEWESMPPWMKKYSKWQRVWDKDECEAIVASWIDRRS